MRVAHCCVYDYQADRFRNRLQPAKGEPIVWESIMSVESPDECPIQIAQLRDEIGTDEVLEVRTFTPFEVMDGAMRDWFDAA